MNRTFRSKYRELEMLKHVGFAGIAISSAMALVMTAGVDPAAAKTKKLSYEAAFAQCKQELGGQLASEGLSTAGRHSAAGACMKKHGYRLKK